MKSRLPSATTPDHPWATDSSKERKRTEALSRHPIVKSGFHTYGSSAYPIRGTYNAKLLLELVGEQDLRRSPLLRRALLKLAQRSPGTKRAIKEVRGRTLVGPTSGIDPASYSPDARARALIRGREILEADLTDAGGAYDADQTRSVLNGISRQALDKRVKDGSVLAVPGPNNRRRYPTLQFGREGLVSGLKDVQAALPTRDPWLVLNFLVNTDDRLGGRKPIDVLRIGDVQSVISAARALGAQGG